MKRVALMIVVLAVLGGGAAWYFLGRETDRNPDLLLFGNVDIRQVELAFRVTGRLTEMRFEEGDAVRVGDLIALLDPVPFEETVAYASAGQSGSRRPAAGDRPGTGHRGRATGGFGQCEARSGAPANAGPAGQCVAKPL